jgi:N-acetylglucosaminyl-diphospho-decaprenol L-rhamnosyltransferase
LTSPEGAARDRVVAIVVNYNAARHLATCLRSLDANGVDDVVVIDNGSVDASHRVARAAGVQWIPTGANLGYGRAANVGAATAQARGAAYLLVCNPDVELDDGAVPTLRAALASSPDLGLAGPRLANPDGSLYPSARTFPDLVDAMGHGLFGMVWPRNRFTRRYRMLDWDHGGRAQVDWVSGACFLVRRSAWDAVGGFNPAYFMYMEDVDLCWRLRQSGWSVGYEPAARVLHVQGVSTNHHPYRMLAAHHLSMWRFARNATAGPKRAALPLVAVGLAARFGAASVGHKFGRAGRPEMLSLDGTTSVRPPRPLP